MGAVVNGSRLWFTLIKLRMQQRTFILSILFCFIALGCFVVGVYLVLSTRTPDPVYTELPAGSTGTSTGQVVAGSAFIELQTAAGEIVINDPRERSGVVGMGDGMYALTTLENETTTSFGVIFNEADGSFAIGLESEPLGETRRQAEQYLLSLLGITDQALCSLNVYVGTTVYVNTFYAGKNLGLSFCPGSVQLP